MESKTEFEEDSPVEDTDAMTIDEKSEIEAKVADALEANYETHDMVARAHSGDNSDEENEDEMLQREEEDKSGEELGSEEKMDSKAGNLTKECESLTLLGEVSLENSNFKQAVEDL